ncbi:MAG: aquaporin [Actinomycetota bacterium]|nr:aquaporin [Actinomycetota bacterium]
MLNPRQSVLAEGLGTGLLVAAVVGSGIAAQGLTEDVGLQLLINALSTVAALGVLITLLLPISGAHFNPVVTLVAAIRGDIDRRLAVLYAAAQFVGAVGGTLLAHAMFEHSAVSWSSADRTGYGQWVGEAVATAGLILTVLLATRSQIPVAVPAWIGAAYFFTSSTSFANPAVTLGRAFTDSFSGIAWNDVLAFFISQIVGAVLALGIVSLLSITSREPA